MRCETCREALSARLDGEIEQVEPEAVDEHLAHCAKCEAWQRAAAQLTRTIRVRPAAATPDLAATILAAADRAGPPAAATAGPAWRALLGLVALVQITLGLAELLGVSYMGHAMVGDSEHLFNESTAWNIALGIGFAVAAGWPRLAAGLLPTLGVFLVVLTGVSIVDLIDGNVELSRVSSHILIVLGMALLVGVHRQAAREPGPGQRHGRSGRTLPLRGEMMPDRQSGGSTGRGGGLRPAGRHAA